MRIDLSELERDPIAFATDFNLTPDELGGPPVTGEVGVRLEGLVRRIGDAYEVEGSVSAAGPLACTRCLGAAPWKAEEAFDLELRPVADAPTDDNMELADDELDVTFLTEGVLDLRQLALEQVLLALPMKFLCRDDCAGLCPTCGADRNRGETCTCADDDDDPRWAPLAAIRDTLDR